MARNRVRIEHGTVVSDRGTLLRGGIVEVFRFGKETGKTAYSTEPAYYRQIRQARLNAVRVVCFDPWQRSKNFPHWDLKVNTDRTAFLAELDRIVDLAGAHDLYALIDYHNLGEYDLAHLEIFWDLVGPRYAQRSHVFYELANEPVSWSPELYTDEVLREMEGVYRRIRSAAPETHLTLLSFANVSKSSPPEGNPMLDVVTRMSGIDWANASVALHPYQTVPTEIILSLRESAPVLITEIDLPAHAGATSQPYLYTSIDGCEYGVEALERIGVSWFSWSIEASPKLEKNFVRGVLMDAKTKGYLWEPDWPASKHFAESSAIVSFFREFPVAEMCHRMGLKGGHVALCTGLACIAAILDGVMLGSLIPISRGAAARSFDFMWNSAPLFWMRPLFPQTVQTYRATFVALGIAVLLVGVLKNAAQYGLHLVTGHWYGIFSARLANAVFARYLSFGKTYFDRHGTGKMAAVIDYNHQFLNLLQALLRLMSEIPVLLVYLAVMVVISWRLTLVVLLVLPPLHFVRRWIAEKNMKPLETSQKRTLGIASRAYEVLRSAPLFRAFAKEDRAVESHAAIMEEVRRSNFDVWVFSGLLPRAQDVTTLIALLLILVGALAFNWGGSSVAAVFVFFFVARLALPRLSAIHEVELEFAQRMPNVRDFFGIFNDNGKYILPGGTRQFEGLVDSIRFQRLTFAYPERQPVLYNISLTIEKGKMTALVGPSGSGKTTLTSLLMRYYDVPPHQIVFDGINIREFSTRSLRNNIALVSQDVILLDDTLRNNLLFGLDEGTHEQELKHVVHDACLDELVATLPRGLETRLGSDGVTLSGGQRQRVAIARAMLKRAPIIILDEATSSLDSQTERLVQKAVDNVVRERTCLVIAHRLSTIKSAHKVVVLDKGRVIEEGSPRELLDRGGRFYEMWEAQKFD